MGTSFLLSELSTTMQLYTLFKNSTGKERKVCSFHELLAARLKFFAAGGKLNVGDREERRLRCIVRIRCDGKTSKHHSWRHRYLQEGNWTTTVEEERRGEERCSLVGNFFLQLKRVLHNIIILFVYIIFTLYL